MGLCKGLCACEELQRDLCAHGRASEGEDSRGKLEDDNGPHPAGTRGLTEDSECDWGSRRTQ